MDIIYYDSEEFEKGLCSDAFVMKNMKPIPAGTSIFSMPDTEKNRKWKSFADKYDIHFIFENDIPEVDFYSVPQFHIMATDSNGGLIGIIGGKDSLVGQSIGILQSMRINQAASLNGDRYVTFHQLSEEQMQYLSEDTRLTGTGSLINVGDTALQNSGLTLYLREYCGNALDAYPAIREIKEGRLPERENEIALPENALQYLEFDGKIGDTISIPLEISLRNDMEAAYEYTADFTLCGILENSYLGYSSGIVEGIVGEGTANALLPERYLLYSTDFKTKSTEQFQSIVNELQEELSIDEANIQYNSILLETLGIAYEKAGTVDTESAGFSFMTVACVMVGVLILLAAGLVIYNILKISVSKRVREYGTIRAIGGEKKQLYRLVTVQLLILCGIGIPVGVLLGLLSSQGILTAAMSFLNPDLNHTIS